jgi:hypothetical protein
MTEPFGLAGLLIVIVSSLVSGRRALLIGQGAASAAFVAHYALIGAPTAAAVMVVAVAQIALAWREDRPRWCTIGFAATIPILALLTASTWQGWASLLAAAALVLSTAGRWGRTDAAVRLPLLASAVAWIAYDIAVDAPLALVTHLFCAGALVWAWLAPPDLMARLSGRAPWLRDTPSTR